MKNTDKRSQDWWLPAINLFLRLSGWVAVPVILATFIGNWLDRRFDSAPWGLLSIVGIAFIASMFGLVHEASREYRKIEKDKKINKKNKDD